MALNVIQKAINKLMDGKSLTRVESKKVMHTIMRGEGSDAQISAFLVALRMKGETVDEITGAVEAVSSRTRTFKSRFENVVDTCGTGGDALSTFNISTAAAFVAAGAGVAVAKHGYKSVSSKSGSADVLSALGINLDISLSDMENCLFEVGIAFLFAPKLETTMRYAMGPRSEIGARTIFNILGPLTNPARTRRQLIGIYDPKLVHPVVEVMQLLGSEQIMAVCGSEGMDEISISGVTHISELVNGRIYDYTLRPENFEIVSAPVNKIQVKNVQESRRMLLSVLKNQSSPARDITLLNAGAAIKVSGKADSIWDGIKSARESLASGTALKKLQDVVAFTRAIAKN